jgi:hypothetical protein
MLGRSVTFVDNHVIMFLAAYDPKLQVDNQFKWELGSQTRKQELLYLTLCGNYKKKLSDQKLNYCSIVTRQNQLYKHQMNKYRTKLMFSTSIADNHALLSWQQIIQSVPSSEANTELQDNKVVSLTLY